MLQAQSGAARNWSYHIPAEETAVIRTRRTVRRVNHKRISYIKLAMAVFGYALLLVALCIKSATLGYEIDKLEQEVQGVTTSNQRLEFQIAEKSSLAHVEQVAAVQLGMHRPDSSTAIAREAVATPVSVASNTYIDADNSSVSQRLLDNLYASLSHLAANN
ncbi:MAG: cell division protein FtsL [Syntrophomonas sp.]|nr:cell division protein FtsL [Syntrophomonas sp.]